jgi:hypothetical protein
MSYSGGALSSISEIRRKVGERSRTYLSDTWGLMRALLLLKLNSVKNLKESQSFHR